ncbi:MAG: DNA translocase FtsK 4TM domain-containing protein, partial [Gammaproteobacteria bacterium]|nr:DNA translocase FtsK 4TM domain-containing protein [Gammaproteobacteria bacterium]
MAEAADAKREGSKLDGMIVRGLREGAFWLLATLALILMIALVTYDMSDRSFSYTGEPGRYDNWIGPAGAWVSDILYVLFGGPALLFPVLLAYGGWLAFKQPPEGEDDEPGA